jgi:hypothetical protein
MELLDEEGETMVVMLARNWWALAWRGLVAVLFGAAALAWPGPTLTALALLSGAFALLDGALVLAAALVGHPGSPCRGALLAEGLLGVATGVLALLRPGLMALAVVDLIAARGRRHRRPRDRRGGPAPDGIPGGMAAGTVRGPVGPARAGRGAVARRGCRGAGLADRVYALAFGILLPALDIRPRGRPRRLPPTGARGPPDRVTVGLPRARGVLIGTFGRS